jgi:NAD(P)-dependent dehydrogenase (short-subunit alcohol dehydrogenase family)
METTVPADRGPRPNRGQTAIVSGALGDIGRATVVELAARGANVGLSDVRPTEDAAEVLEAARARGVRARYDRVDVADVGAVRSWVAAVESDLGLPTLVIANAATVTLAGVRDVAPEQWSRELRVNLDGAFHVTQAAALRLLARETPGRIVFVGSWAAHAPHVHIPAYCVAKAGLRMLCKCMALDLAPHGILVNEVAPGYVDAGLSAQVWSRDPAARDAAADHVPTGQLISADAVARQIAYFCEPENRHTTGSVLLMDGGLSLVGPQRRRP